MNCLIRSCTQVSHKWKKQKMKWIQVLSHPGSKPSTFFTVLCRKTFATAIQTFQFTD